jgi:hypothetical protein
LSIKEILANTFRAACKRVGIDLWLGQRLGLAAADHATLQAQIGIGTIRAKGGSRTGGGTRKADEEKVKLETGNWKLETGGLKIHFDVTYNFILLTG